MDKDIRALFNIEPNPMLGVRDGKIIFANAAAVRELGRKPDGEPAEGIVPDYVLEVGDGGFTATAEFSGRKATVSAQRSGDTVYMVFVPEEDASGAELGPYVVMNRLKSRVSTLRMAAEQVFETFEFDSNPKMSNYLAMFYHSYYGLMHSIKNVDSALKIMDKSETFNPVPTDLSRLCAELIDTVSHMTAKNRAKIIYRGVVVGLDAVVDREKMIQLILCLLANSLENTSRDGKVVVDLKPMGNKLVLSVDDNGCGMSSDMISTVFSRFNRKLSLSEMSGGPGFGMYIAKGIADMHQGVMLVESREGKGTSVRVMIPTDLPVGSRFEAGKDIYSADGMNNILTELADVLESRNYSQEYMD